MNATILLRNGAALLAASACLMSAGCRTGDLNPPVPRANTGYVDFYTDSSGQLSWKVRRASEPTGEMRTVFSEFKPIPGNVLRLAAPPGTYRFEVWFSNQTTTGPQTVVVQVADARVTPVHVTLAPAGSASVVGQSYEYRSTARATRRVTKTSAQPQQVFQIGLTAGTPQAYQPKEQMSYWSVAAK
ncbi:MAG TPA: hypothetical protein VJA21_23320 [Verrucomicrobiae bacterium]